MIGFPLDDVWHRIFGQDVTLWGPTHVLMIGGASLAPIAAWLLLVEGRCAVGKPGPGRLLLLAWEVQLAGAALDRPLDAPARVRLRRPAVPARLPPDPDRARGERRSRRRAPAARPRRRAGRDRRVPARDDADGADHRPRLRPHVPALPALHRRGAARRARRAGADRARRGRRRRRLRRADRHRRRRRRVGLVAGRDAAAVERRAAARGADAGARGGGRRRPARRLSGRRAALAATPVARAAARARRRARRRDRVPGDPDAHRPAAALPRADVTLDEAGAA